MVRTTGPTGLPDEFGGCVTDTTLALLGAQETIWTAAGVLCRWIEQSGVPVALNTDWKTVYVKEATEQQLLRGEVPETQFGRMCKRLGIRIIAAIHRRPKGAWSATTARTKTGW